MKVRQFKPRSLAMAIALVLANSTQAISPAVTDSTAPRPEETFGQYTGDTLSLTNAPRVPGRYIVRFTEQAVPTHFESLAAGGAAQLTTAFKTRGSLRRAHLD